MLARTAEVRPEQIAECRRFANLMPPPPDQCSGEMPGALGLFRGETIEYIIAKAFAGPGGWPQLQYVFAPSAVMRALLGNVRVFESFAKEPVPAFASQRTDLPRFVLDPPEPADPDTQADDLIALLGYCKNSLKVVEGLLAGLVQAMGLAIINAPLSLHDRLTFVQGLLTLLPGPARVGVSFATSVIDPGRTNTQIKFLASDLRPNRHLVYDWASGTLLTPPPADSYSKYILSQLRLDTSLVVQQTEKMARTAVWRAMRKDDLANALAWVSRRASLDSAVEQGLPAERKTVASVLREDPTLPDHLRLKYSQHLLKLTLALDEPGDADILPVIAVQNQDLASAIYEQLENAAKSEHAMAVYHLLGRWIAQPPMGVDVNRWRTLLSTATLTLATQRAEGDADALIAFLSQYLDVPPGLQLEGAVAQAIGICRKRAYDNPEVARAIFLLGAQYLPAGGLQRLLSDTRIVAQLPEAVQVALANLTPSHAAAAPVGVLMRAAQTFPPERQPIVLARLIEWATLIARIDLIDASALAGLLKIAGSSNAPRFDVMMQHVIDDMSPLEVVKTLDTRTQQFLVELSLVRGNFPQATRQLEFYQAQIYKGTPQEDLRALTYAVFRDVPLPIPKLIDALTGLNDSQLRPIARVSAYVGALESWNWSNELEPVMRRFTAITFSDPRIIAGIGIDPVLRLLKANIDRQDAMEAFRLAEAVVDFALTLDSALETTGVALVNRVFMQINAIPDMHTAALELPRTVIRRAPPDKISRLMTLLNPTQNTEIELTLDAAYRLRMVLGGGDFLAFAEQIKLGASLLIDIAVYYHEGRELPSNFRLRRAVDAMPGGLTPAERQRLVENLTKIADQVIKLSQVRYRKRSKAEIDAYEAQLLAGALPPSTGIDALRWIGGYLGSGQGFTLDLSREAQPHLLGERSTNLLLRDTDKLTALLDGLLQAFPDKDMFMVDLKAWKAEVAMQWGLVSLYNQRQLSTFLPEDAQLLAQVIRWIGERGNPRSLESNGYGKQLRQGRAQPRSVVDVLQWMSGYFAKEHDH